MFYKEESIMNCGGTKKVYTKVLKKPMKFSLTPNSPQWWQATILKKIFLEFKKKIGFIVDMQLAYVCYTHML